MKETIIICFFAGATHALSQNFNTMPSDNFFSPHALHRSTINLMPTAQFTFFAKGNLLYELTQSSSNPSELLKTSLNNNKSKNYLYLQAQSNLLDYRKNTGRYEIGWSVGLKSSFYMQSNFNIPNAPKVDEVNPNNTNLNSTHVKIKLGGYAAVSYGFSFLKNIHKNYLKTYGFKIELLTGINAIKGQLNSKGVQAPDSTHVNLIIARNGFISRSKKRLLPEEFLPFFKNPGIALSYGMKWQINAQNTWSINLNNFGFIYYSRTVNNLHKGFDTLNINRDEKPFNNYYEQLKTQATRQNEAYYFLPFELNSTYNHQFNIKHSASFLLTLNPIFKNIQTALIWHKHIRHYEINSSLNSINFSRMLMGLGLSKKAKFISWGINFNYLVNTLSTIKNGITQTIDIGYQNHLNTQLFLYYNFIKRTKRLTSKPHRLISIKYAP
ncbi:MAG: hypothetical protein PSX81_04555 [bacterium]|nr:hypothetical protein [bacterium]